jgi:hypothetical protein
MLNRCNSCKSYIPIKDGTIGDCSFRNIYVIHDGVACDKYKNKDIREII